jgi:hypothetical protein
VLTTFSQASCHGGQGYGESGTVLLAGVCGPVPSDATFTWAKAKKLLGIR